MALCSPLLRGLQDLLRYVGVRHPRYGLAQKHPCGYGQIAVGRAEDIA